ncbi:hypothetical protein OHB35_30165 [Streptomyces phaeochromogenes]|uniref:PknH-like extracellular domain-containing protein n=1 Tax=Streptomyces phaeochromogenes TaxID=1923 RepID=A0ABZ1HJ82_STRPH|nr:hypothetical protein [Streptomyces phaeochromogenes]WSD17164.1 hypothetical protein OHB35_30165 [Streptomyces phaeochromogenes]
MKRTTALAASALCLSALACLTACGGGDSDSGTDAADKPEATASRTKEVSPADRLAKLMITKADVGGYAVEEPSDEFVFAKSPDEVTLDKKVCTPLAYAMNQLPLGEPQADLTRVASKDGLNGGFTYVTLTAYEDGGAESAMAGLSKAVASCGDGFTAKSKNGTSPYDSVTAEPTTKSGDESLAFKSTMTVLGTTHTLHSAAVRHDDVIAVYFAVDGRAIAESRPSDVKLAAAVVEAQNAKLG